MENLNKKINNLIKEKRYEEVSKLLKEAANHFWSEDYVVMSEDEKIIYWTGVFSMSMRQRGESGLEEMGFFSPKVFASVKEHEPAIETMLPAILKKLGVSKIAAYKMFGI